jgi:hypothetical protein
VGAQGGAGEEKLKRCTQDDGHDQGGLADDIRLRGRAGAAAEVHAQVAMLVFVATITQSVRRIDGAADDERAGGNQGHQAIAAECLAQQMRDPLILTGRVAATSPRIWLIM